jgi:signal transduction histidine kinase
LLVGDRLLGVVSAQLATGLDPADLETLASLGVVLGVMLDRARLEDEARARDEWTRLVAHELRQPLQAIAFHARARARSAECGCVAAADRVIERVRRIDRIAGDLVDTSLDIAKVALMRRPTDLVTLATGLATPPDARTTRVRVEARGEIPEIEVDPARIEQILANLISNAVKYGRPDSEIELLLERTEDEVVISVTNEGEDIPEQERSRIFDRHYRARGDMAVGWGIGLYVSRGLAKAHAGRLSVASGGGLTTFSLALPRVRR